MTTMITKRLDMVTYTLQKIRSQSGQSMAEFVVIAPVILFLMMATIQVTLIFHAKITLNFAAYEATRYGTWNHADFEEVKEGFSRGLGPLFSYYNPEEKNKGVKSTATSYANAFMRGRRKVLDIFDDPKNLISIERLSPKEEDFKDYADDDEIPNDNLIYRSSKKGKSSGRSIQDANLLHLRITYWYPLYVPFVNKAIFAVVCGMDKWQTHPVCADTDSDLHPFIPLTSVSVMRMQSSAKKSDGFADAGE